MADEPQVRLLPPELDVASPGPTSAPSGPRLLPPELDPETRRAARETSSEHKPELGAFTRTGKESEWEAFKKGAGTTALKAATGVVGLPGDVVGLADYLTTGAQSLMSDKSHAQLQQELADRVAAKRRAGDWHFPTSEEVYKEVADRYKLGEYEPTSTTGKLAMAAGVGAAGMIGPGMAVKGARAIIPGAKKLLGAGPSVGEFAKLAATGAGAGAAAEGAAEALPQYPLAPLAAGLAVPLVVHGARSIYNPERRARNRLLGDLGDKEASMALIQGADKEHPIAGIRYTLDTLTEDPKLAQAAYALETRNPQFKAYMDQLRAEQVEARRAHLARAAGDEAEELAATQALERIQQGLADSRSAAHAAMTDPSIPEAGELYRGLVDKAHNKWRAEVDRLFKAVDPNNDALVSTDNLRGALDNLRTKLAQGAEQRTELTGPLAEALKLVGKQGKTLTFNEIRELEKSLEALRVTAKTSPDATIRGHTGDIGDLKGAIAKDMDTVLPGSSGGDPRARLEEAKKHFIEGTKLFRNAYIRPTIKRGEYDFTMLGDAAANRYFKSGTNGYNATKAALEATNYAPEALQHLEDIATGQLRRVMKDNTVLTPEQLQQWKNNYGPALKAIEEARERLGMSSFQEQFNNAADATRQLATLQKGVAGSLIGAQSPEEVGRFMNNLVRNPQGALAWRDILGQIPDAARDAAAEGLRRAHMDNMIGQFSNQLNGRIRANEFAKYVNNNRRTLSEIYGPQFKNIQDVLNDLQRVDKMRTTKGVDIGSNTAKNLATAMANAQRNNESIGSVIAQISLAHTLAGAPGAVGAGITKAMWLKDLLSAAGSAKADAHYMHAMMDPSYAKDLLQPMFKNGVPNAEALRRIASRAAVLSGYMTGAQEPTRESIERQGRASGGRIGVDPAKRAAELIRQAEHTHKRLTQVTKPLLNLPDEHITKALSIANEAI